MLQVSGWMLLVLDATTLSAGACCSTLCPDAMLMATESVLLLLGYLLLCFNLCYGVSAQMLPLEGSILDVAVDSSCRGCI